MRRLHIAINTGVPFVEGYRAIQETIHWYNGEFLTAALSSAESREQFFSVAMRHCARAGLPGLTLDDQLVHLIRALECLCKRYGFSTQDLTDGLAPGTKNTIEGSLAATSAGIKTLTNPMDPVRAQVLRIADRVRSAAQVERDFGLAVKALADHFGLQDFNVLQPYYAMNPGPGGRDWVALLSYYRGAVMHQGFVDLDSPGTPIGEVLGFIFHLHDLLVRILLKIIGYRGMYQPRSVRGTAAETADWFRIGVNIDSVLRIPTLGIK
ncbi:MAG TPA: hypothetical protein VKO18_20075 [Terriglobia bacterium]|nr:hypothetical protein [Terriglobia bacterium]